MFTFAEPRQHRRPSLTPMIDVVFLLLVFFMLASRFGIDNSLPLITGGGGDAPWEGPPRLVEILPESIVLNGQAVALDALAGRLAPLLPRPDAPVLLRPAETTDLARMVAVIDALKAAGIGRLVVVEQP